MGFAQRLWGSKKEEIAPNNTDVNPVTEEDGIANEKATSSDEEFGAKQAGVLKVEAAAQVWSKKHLIGAYVMYDSSDFAISRSC